MSDKKISDLSLTPAVNLDDTFEKSRHNAAPSERMTTQQLVTFLQTALASLSLNGGNIVAASTGQLTLGKHNFADGSLLLVDTTNGNNMIALSGNDGSGSFALGQISLNADGSAQFANGAILLEADGKASFDTGQISFVGNGGANFGGSVGFAGNTVIGITGDISLGGGPSASISAFDGSAYFANGQNTIDAAGNLGIAGTQVVTAQQPAIADATNAVDVITQFNLLLAALRIHGLIAP
jgi:hypothetical protein